MPGALQGQLHLQHPRPITTTPASSPSQSPASSAPLDSSEKDEFQKVLYLNQPFTDNHVPSRFLEAMLYNHQLYDHTYTQLLALTAPLLNKISTIFIWLCLIYSIVSSQHAQSIISTLQSDESTAGLSESAIHTLISDFYQYSAEQPLSHKKNVFHKLFSVVRPVFTCPHRYTTIPYLNIDLPANPFGYFLCEFKDVFVFNITSASLTYITVAILLIHTFFAWIGKPPQSQLIHYRSAIQWKYIIKLIWYTTIILFLTTPVLISTIPIYSPTTILVLVVIFTALTVLRNDYSDLFDPMHLTYTTETLLTFPRLSKYLTKHFNYGNTGYVHIHTHMTREEVVNKFESVAKQSVAAPMSPESPGAHRNGSNNSDFLSNGKQFQIDEHLHIPVVFSQIFAYICLISIFSACGVYQYIHSSTENVVQSFIKFYSATTGHIGHIAPNFGDLYQIGPDQVSLQDNFFVFVVFSALILSFPEILLYLVARAYHNRSTTLISILEIWSGWKKSSTNDDGHKLKFKNNVKLITNYAKFLYAIYLSISVLLAMMAVLLLTCHSPVQTFFLLVIFIIVAVISPLALLSFRRIPGAKRVIRGSWDYDDSNEQGSDNI